MSGTWGGQKSRTKTPPTLKGIERESPSGNAAKKKGRQKPLGKVIGPLGGEWREPWGNQGSTGPRVKKNQGGGRRGALGGGGEKKAGGAGKITLQEQRDKGGITGELRKLRKGGPKRGGEGGI